MQLFDEIDNPDNKDKKLTLIERAIILSLTGVGKIALWKIRRAKTYGDIMKIGDFLENRFIAISDKYEDKSDEEISDAEAVDIICKDIDSVKESLTELEL